MPSPALSHKLQQTVRETPVITGFSYAFARLLLDRILVLKENDAIFEGGLEAAENAVKNHFSGTFTDEAKICIDNLGQSISFNFEVRSDPKPFEEFVENARKFLAIFESEPSKRIDVKI